MWLMLGILAAALLSLFFSTLTYSLRDFSRARFEDQLIERGREPWFEPTLDARTDLIFITGTGRLLANMLLIIGCLMLFESNGAAIWAEYLGAFLLAGPIALIASVAVPTALAEHFAETILATFVRALHWMLVAFWPIAKVMHWTDQLVRRLAGRRLSEAEPEQIEKDILSAVEEGEKEGVVDEAEREMIESVIEFRDIEAGQAMTARPEIVAIESGCGLDRIRDIVQESGHSRIPVYEGTLDHIVGVLYARDLLRHLGTPPELFDLRSALRPAYFVPETKLLRELLRDFKVQKVHIAIVLDEYGGTAGLVTIEDVLEELVGEIIDEHEPLEPDMLRRINNTTFEADARLHVSDLNRKAALNLPEDAGYDTVGGFITTTLGQIPRPGTSFQQNGARFTVIDAEPHKVKHVRIELLPQPAPTVLE